MVCPRCNNTSPDTARFCSHCGQSFLLSDPDNTVHRSTTDSTARDAVCPRCGYPNPQHAQFCLSCGKHLTDEDDNGRPYSAPANLGKIIGVGLLACLSLSIILLALNFVTGGRWHIGASRNMKLASEGLLPNTIASAIQSDLAENQFGNGGDVTTLGAGHGVSPCIPSSILTGGNYGRSLLAGYYPSSPDALTEDGFGLFEKQGRPLLTMSPEDAPTIPGLKIDTPFSRLANALVPALIQQHLLETPAVSLQNAGIMLNGVAYVIGADGTTTLAYYYAPAFLQAMTPHGWCPFHAGDIRITGVGDIVDRALADGIVRKTVDIAYSYRYVAAYSWVSSSIRNAVTIMDDGGLGGTEEVGTNTVPNPLEPPGGSIQRVIRFAKGSEGNWYVVSARYSNSDWALYVQ